LTNRLFDFMDAKLAKAEKDMITENTIVAKTISTYRNQGATGYAVNEKHLREVWRICKAEADKIQDGAWITDEIQDPLRAAVVKAELEHVNLAVFMFSVCADESLFDHYVTAYNERCETYDSGITQINSQHWESINARLPEELKKHKWYSIEKNIKGRFIWIKDRAQQNLPWQVMTKKRGWALYKKLTAALKAAEGGK